MLLARVKAVRNFFRNGNLSALRERAPRSTAERVDAPARRRAIPIDWLAYARAAAVVAVATGVAWLMDPVFELSNLIMAYLLGIVVVATRHGRGPSLLAAVLSVAAFDFCFVPPYFTFAVSDVRYASGARPQSSSCPRVAESRTRSARWTRAPTTI